MVRTPVLPEASSLGALTALLRPSLAPLTDDHAALRRRSATEASRLDSARHLFKRAWTAVAFF
jgi:hypothetical protein